MTTTEDHPDLDPLVESWVLALRAERKAASTIKSYTTGVRGFLAWCEATGTPPVLTRAAVNGYVASMLDDGQEPATARARQLGVRRFSDWLAEEGELPADPLLGVKAPKLDQKVIEPLTEEQLKALLAACSGLDPLRDKRDAAVIRFMLETGTRAGETAALELDDVNLAEGVAIVRRGKGGKGRSVPFGPQTALAIDRYTRVRRTHRLAGTPALWLGDRGKPFSYDGLHKSLALRARMAGIEGFHPHLLRHTAAHRWLAAGGSEGGLMAVAGWTRPDMLVRYTRARAADRAAAEARDLNLGDL
ncbi:tyrosine-type recombinase/integrase [Promicromonospora aerolata]|uniref:Tyrosine-type recombinase/integrase n=1 Tax=Promicromonospora aerolata TaxID=195749 RepID=A0ABW4VFG3_9MICO